MPDVGLVFKERNMNEDIITKSMIAENEQTNILQCLMIAHNDLQR